MFYCYQITEGGNLTIAVLQFTPRPSDDGAMLVCQAENAGLGQQPLQDSKLLSVNCEYTTIVITCIHLAWRICSTIDYFISVVLFKLVGVYDLVIASVTRQLINMTIITVVAVNQVFLCCFCD